MAFGVLGATNANATYMSNCNTLISAWEKCQANEQSCAVEKTAIEKQCKCHALKGDKWKLIMAAVAKDNVCGKPPEEIILPPPPPQPAKLIKAKPKKGGGQPHGEEPKPDGKGK